MANALPPELSRLIPQNLRTGKLIPLRHHKNKKKFTQVGLELIKVIQLFQEQTLYHPSYLNICERGTRRGYEYRTSSGK